jgi:hypothetical protein
MPKATTKERIALFEARPKSSSPTRGSTLRSSPTMAPTNPLSATRIAN